MFTISSGLPWACPDPDAVVPQPGDDVAPTDLATFAAIIVLFGMIAVTASWLPARRASRLDPMNAIREDIETAIRHGGVAC